MDIASVRQIEVTNFDTACIEKKYLAHYNGRHFEISSAVAEFISLIQESSSVAEVTDKFSSQKQTHYSSDDILSLYKQCIEPILAEKPTKKRKGSFLWDTILIPANWVEKFLPIFRYFFQRKVVLFLLSCILTAEIFFIGGDLKLHLGQVDIYLVLCVLLLFLCASLFHEFGHATAAHHYGAKQQGIGFGLYLNFPAFYTDVSDVWKLTRKQRVVVNFAGVYFQLIFLLPLFIVFFITHNNILKYFILTVNLNLAFTLNPFFKFDGYWIMSDMLGVPNLRARSKELFVYLWRRLRGTSELPPPFLFTIRRTEKIAMIIYTCVVNLFFGYYFFYIFPIFIIAFFRNFPTLFNNLIHQIAQGQAPGFSLIMTVVTQFATIGLMIFFLYRITTPLLKKIFGSKRTTHE